MLSIKENYEQNTGRLCGESSKLHHEGQRDACANLQING